MNDKPTVVSNGRMTRKKRERLEYLAKFIADESTKPLRVTVDIGRSYKALWYDRKRNEFYLSAEGDGSPANDQRWPTLAEALDAFDDFSPRRV